MKTTQEKTPVKLSAYETILQLARKHKAQSLCQTAEDLYKQAIIIARATPEFPPARLMESLYELAAYFSFQGQGKDEQAKPLWEEIKSYCDRYSKSNDHIYVQTIFSLAQLNEKQGHPEAALTLFKEFLQKQELEFGDESLEICPTMDQLAAFYCRQKKYSLAEALYLRILVIKEFHLGTCSVEINYTVDSLIDIFQKLGKWRLAEYMLNRQKAILVALHGKESLCVASCALRLAQLQESRLKQLDRATENLAFALKTYKNKFGEQIGYIALLQKKLDQMLFTHMENQAIADGSITSDDAITLQLPVNSQNNGHESTLAIAPSLITV